MYDLSESFKEQLTKLSDVGFVLNSFDNIDLAKLRREINIIRNDKNISNAKEVINDCIRNFISIDGKSFQELRQKVSSEVLKMMSFDELKKFNSLIEKALANLSSNEYWQNLSYKRNNFDVKTVEMVLPDKRGGRCFRADLENGNYKDLVTISPVAFNTVVYWMLVMRKKKLQF